VLRSDAAAVNRWASGRGIYGYMQASAWFRVLAVPMLAAGLWVEPGGAQPAGEWRPLFDGKSLQGWRETPFTGHGKVHVEDGAIVLGPGGPLTGITLAGEFPTSNYELRLEAVRLKGNDFFATVTFPVRDSFCTWVTGGWGGDIVGLSSIDGWDASENETRATCRFGSAFRLRPSSPRSTTR
jgi:hypothetical protein